MAVSAPCPAACRMVPPSATTGEEEEEEEEGGSGRGGWVLVAGVREDPAPSFRSSSPPSGGNASPYAQGDGTWASRGAGQPRGSAGDAPMSLGARARSTWRHAFRAWTSDCCGV